MPRWLDAAAREKLVLEQRREMADLRAEVEKLSRQNERLRTAMRRCLTCEYRIAQLDLEAAESRDREP